MALTVAGAVAAAGGLAVGVTAALAADNPAADSADIEQAESGALPEAAEQVTLVQRVMQRVVIRSVRDPRSRLSANGRDLWEISALGSFDVPSAALRAYKHAADEAARTTPSCQIPWTLLAGIGRVESDHGRYGGSVLGNDGLPRPAIVGIALDGVGPVAAIHDSDNGEWDGDTVWDRAVGPMQFIPGTWASSGRDGDGDGIENPNDIDDAALAAAYYLCPSSGSILPDTAMDAAIRSYNNSEYYVDLVRAFARGYETGVFVIPSPPPAEGISADAPTVKPTVTKVDKNGTPVKGDGKSGSGKGGSSGGSTGGSGGGQTGGGSTGGTTTGGGGTSTPTPTPTNTPTPEPTPEFSTVSGQLTPCDGGYCVGGVALDWGALGGQASADFDGDGAPETKDAELAGLVDKPVTVEVRYGTKVVARLGDRAW